MSKFLMIALALAGVVNLGLWYSLGHAQTSSNNLDWATLQERADSLERKLEDMKRFREEMDRILGELADDNLSLAEGVEQMEAAGRKYNPSYVENIYLSRKGKTLKVQIAYNLVGHLEVAVKDARTASPALNKTMGRLSTELREICLANHETFVPR